MEDHMEVLKGCRRVIGIETMDQHQCNHMGVVNHKWLIHGEENLDMVLLQVVAHQMTIGGEVVRLLALTVLLVLEGFNQIRPLCISRDTVLDLARGHMVEMEALVLVVMADKVICMETQALLGDRESALRGLALWEQGCIKEVLMTTIMGRQDLAMVTWMSGR